MDELRRRPPPAIGEVDVAIETSKYLFALGPASDMLSDRAKIAYPNAALAVQFITDVNMMVSVVPLTRGLCDLLVAAGELVEVASDNDLLDWVAKWAAEHGTGNMTEGMPPAILRQWNAKVDQHIPSTTEGVVA